MFFQSNAVALEVRAQAADKLAAFAPAGLNRVFFVNSGAEANENALRAAFKKTGRKKIIALVAGSAILIGSIGAWAGVRSHWHHGDHMQHAIDHISEELKLDDAQRGQLENLGTTLVGFKKTLRNGDEVDVILASIQGTSLDQTALNSLIDNKLNTVRAQAPEVITAVAQFYDGLDVQQQTQAREKLEEVASWAKRHRHNHD